MVKRGVWCALVSATVSLFGSPGGPAADEASGSLVISLLPYEAEIQLNEGVRAQLDQQGIEWGLVGSDLIVSFVSRRYVAVELPQLTRYGELDTVELPPGDYTITCIGLDVKKPARDFERLLAESAFINKDVVRFSIRPGEATRLELRSEIRKQGGFWLKTFVPRVHATVHDGKGDGRQIVINDRIESSIPWTRYSFPSKAPLRSGS